MSTDHKIKQYLFKLHQDGLHINGNNEKPLIIKAHHHFYRERTEV